MSFSLFASVAGELLEFGSNVISAQAARKSALAQMAALEEEKTWNMGVMERNLLDFEDRSILSSWGAGINYQTGTNAAIIAENEAVTRNEIGFRSKQYDKQIDNLRSQSRRKFLGLL